VAGTGIQGCLGVCALLAGFVLSPSAFAERFEFVALGDTAYNLPRDYPVYSSLIQRINSAKPAFSIHVGDTWGAIECSETEHRRILGFFQEYRQPVIYTPGDNEWVDCLKPEQVPMVQRYLSGKATREDFGVLQDGLGLDGGYERRLSADGLSSLKTIRSVFFATDRSLGGKTIKLTRQADVSEYNDMVENAMWDKGGVSFGTVHVPGSGNNFFINDTARAMEAIDRNKANIDWLKQLFASATEKQSRAVVIALHAGMFTDEDGGDFSGRAIRGGSDGPFHWTALAIRDLGAKFGKPVLLINGDFHELVIDRPFMVSGGESEAPKYANIIRLQVYGAPEIKAVKVSVDTDTPWVFGFEPLHD